MLNTFLRVEDRVIGRLEGHLSELGVGRVGRRGPLRRGMSVVGSALAGLTALRGLDAILQRVRGEEWRGSERYGRETDWTGWSEAERDTIDGHRCDQLYQAHWVELVQRDLREGRVPSGKRPPRF